MAITYDWRCKFCGSENDAGLSACAACGKPAVVRPVDIERARTVEATDPKPKLEISPPTLSAIFIVLVVVALFGAILERFAWGVRIELLSWVLIIGAGVPAWIIWKIAVRPIGESGKAHDA
jgi:hypothetical protein